MKCKDCTELHCPYRTSDGEKECYYYTLDKDSRNVGLTSKGLWIADVAVKILASCPYPYMSLDGYNSIPAAEYAAEQAKRMANKIFG